MFSCHWSQCSRSLSKILDLVPPVYSSIPSFFVQLAQSAFSFLANSFKSFGLCLSPLLLALLMHLVSVKLCGFIYLSSTKDGFTYQAAVRELNSKQIQYNRRMKIYSCFTLINNIVLLFLIACEFSTNPEIIARFIYIYISQFRAGLLSTCPMYPFSCK